MNNDSFSIEQARAEIARDLAETRKLQQEADKYIEEREKLIREARKLDAEHDKLRRDYWLAPWALIAGVMTTGAALFAAGAAFIKLVG